MKNNQKNGINTSEMAGRSFTYLYLLVMLGLFQPFFPGTIFGILEVKNVFFIIAAGIYICLTAVPFLYQGIVRIKEGQKPEVRRADLFALLYLVAILVSTMAAWNRTYAVFGNTEKRTGAIVMLLCLMTCYAIKKYARVDAIVIWAGLLGSLFIYLCGVFTACKVNFLGLQTGMTEAQRMIFPSPIGNTDFNASYISLMLPAAMAMFLICQEAFTKRVLAVYSYIGVLAVFCIRAESAVVMLGSSFALLLYFALEQEQWILRYISMVQIFIAANITVFLMKLLLKDHMYNFDGLGGFFIQPGMIAFEALLFIFLFWLQKKKDCLKEKYIRQLQKLYKYAVLIIIIIGVAVAAAVNLLFQDQAAGTILKYLLLTDQSFSGRGYIWIRTVKAFMELPIVNQIFGCGLGCYHCFIEPFYGAEMYEMAQILFYEPHNDFLYVLSTTGIVGVIGFFGMIGSAIVSALRRRKDREMQLMVIAALAAFLVQGLVNSFTIFVIPFLFIILGMADSEPKGRV